jgi:hypothetical protein
MRLSGTKCLSRKPSRAMTVKGLLQDFICFQEAGIFQAIVLSEIALLK